MGLLHAWLALAMLSACAPADPGGVWQGSTTCIETWGLVDNDVSTQITLEIEQGDGGTTRDAVLELSSHGDIADALGWGSYSYDSEVTAAAVAEYRSRGRFDLELGPLEILEGDTTRLDDAWASYTDDALNLYIDQVACGYGTCTEKMACDMYMTRQD